MIRRRDITRGLLSILLVGLVGFVAGLPSGTDFILCFGSDGHVDFSSLSCPQSPNNSRHAPADSTGDREHHQDCIDLELVCGAFDSGYFASANTASRIGADTRQEGRTPAADLRFRNSVGGGYALYTTISAIADRHVAPSRIALERSTVLLI